MKFKKYLKNFFFSLRMPTECKIEKAEKNLKTLWPLLLIAFGFGLYMLAIRNHSVTYKNDPMEYYAYVLPLTIIPLVCILLTLAFLKFVPRENYKLRSVIFYISMAFVVGLLTHNFIINYNVLAGFSVWIAGFIIGLIMFCVHPVFILLCIIASVTYISIKTVYFLHFNSVLNFTLLLTFIFILSVIRYRSVIREYVSVHSLQNLIFTMQAKVIDSFAGLVERRDQFTGEHVMRTSQYVQLLCGQLQRDKIFTDQLTDEKVNYIVNAAPLHDIGKIYISDVILNKPGRLTEDEFEVMKTHTVLGSKIIQEDFEGMEEADFLVVANEMALCHHERYDGQGYPKGLSGESIPLSARIMAVADVLDALLSKRQYKEAFTKDEAFEIMLQGRGSQFDPIIIDTLMKLKSKI